MSWFLSDLERRFANLISFGAVTALDTGRARVKVKIGALETDWLPWLTAHAGKVRSWSAPELGEQVMVLAPVGDLAQGVVLPALYQQQFNAPSADPDTHLLTFQDGTTLSYDETSKTLDLTSKGPITLNAQGAVTVNAAGSIALNAAETSISGNLTVGGSASIAGGATVGQNLSVGGGLTAGTAGGSGGASATYRFKGNLILETGDFIVEQGDIDVPNGDVTASDRSLISHGH